MAVLALPLVVAVLLPVPDLVVQISVLSDGVALSQAPPAVQNMWRERIMFTVTK